MTAIGFTWFFQALEASDNSAVFVVGVLGLTLPYAILIHLLISFPSGRLQDRLQRAIVAIAYFVDLVMQGAGSSSPTRRGKAAKAVRKTRVLIAGHAALGEAISAVAGSDRDPAGRADRRPRLPALAPQRLR